MDIGISISVDLKPNCISSRILYISYISKSNLRDNDHHVVNHYRLLCEAVKNAPGFGRLIASANEEAKRFTALKVVEYLSNIDNLSKKASGFDIWHNDLNLISRVFSEGSTLAEFTAVTGTLSVTVVRQAHQPVEVTAPVEATVASTSSATATDSATSQNRWLFSSKESQSFLYASIPFLDFGARMYDPITARWTAQDPLAEKYYAVSPYAYCLGNPISNIDDDGQMPQVVAGAIIGAAIEGVIAVVEGKSLREIGGAVVGGAVEGALVSLTGGLSLGMKAASIFATGVAGAVGSVTSQAIGEGSIDAMQVAADAIGGITGGAVSASAKSAAQYAGGKIAARAEEKYSSKAMESSVRKEVKKEMIRTGVNPAGKAGGRKLKKEVNDRIANGLKFELSIANAVKDTKAGDVAGSIAAHRISHVIYDKEE